jgi:hypothetical protein
MMAKTSRPRSSTLPVQHRKASAWDHYSLRLRALEEESITHPEDEISWPGLVHSVGFRPDWDSPVAVEAYGRYFVAHSESQSHIWGTVSQGLPAETYRVLALPAKLVEELTRLSEARGLSLPDFLRQLVDRATRGLPYAGLIQDDEDLSLKVEEVLARLQD